jgi:hypothetical protein
MEESTEWGATKAENKEEPGKKAKRLHEEK